MTSAKSRVYSTRAFKTVLSAECKRPKVIGGMISISGPLCIEFPVMTPQE